MYAQPVCIVLQYSCTPTEIHHTEMCTTQCNLTDTAKVQLVFNAILIHMYFQNCVEESKGSVTAQEKVPHQCLAGGRKSSKWHSYYRWYSRQVLLGCEHCLEAVVETTMELVLGLPYVPCHTHVHTLLYMCMYMHVPQKGHAHEKLRGFRRQYTACGYPMNIITSICQT